MCDPWMLVPVTGNCLTAPRNGIAVNDGEVLLVTPAKEVRQGDLVVLDMLLPHEGELRRYSMVKWLVSPPPDPAKQPVIEVLETHPEERVTRIPAKVIQRIYHVAQVLDGPGR